KRKRNVRFLKKRQTEGSGMRLNSFINGPERIGWKTAPVRIGFEIRIERHVVQSLVRIRIRERPSIIRTFSDLDEFVRRMIVDVGLQHSAIIALLTSIPSISKWVTDVVAFIYDGPQFARSWDERQAFGIPDTACKDLEIFSIEVASIDRGSHRIAPGVRRVRICRRRDIQIQLLIWSDRDVLQLVPINPAKARTATIGKIRKHNFLAGFIHVPL